MADTYGIIVAEEEEYLDKEQAIIDREQENMETLKEGEEFTFTFPRKESDGNYTVTITDNEVGKEIFSTVSDYIKTDQFWNEAEEVEEFVIRIPLPDSYFDETVADEE